MELYVGHSRKRYRTGQLMQIEREHIELVIGKGKCPLANPEITEVSYVEETWIISLGNFLHRCNGRIVTDRKPVVKKQRKNDEYLMILAESLSKSNQIKIQQCRLYLQVILLSDVCTSEGNKIEESF